VNNTLNNILFARLSSRAWNLPVLAHLAENDGCRVSPTAHAVGAGRNIVGQTFSYLAELGMLQRSTGHGHPLRPEFQLTLRGQPVAVWARCFLNGMSEKEWETARRAWTLPVLRLIRNPHTFTELSTTLQPVTDRGLSLCLGRLVEAKLAEKHTFANSRKSNIAVGRGLKIAQDLEATFQL